MSYYVMNDENNTTTTTTTGSDGSGSGISISMDDSKIPSSWDPQDDILLRHLKEIKKLGWKDIAQYFKNRTPNACQFRWRRLKSGSLKHKSVASTMELTDHDLENVVIPELPKQQTDSSSSTKQVKQRKSRASSLVSAGTVSVTATTPTTTTTSTMTTMNTQSTQGTKGTGSVYQHQGFVKPRAYSSSSSLAVNGNPVYGYDAQNEYQPQHHQNNNSSVYAPIQLPHPATTGFHNTTTTTTPSSSMLNSHFISVNDEKHGFVPKVLVRSRRGSAVSVSEYGGVDSAVFSAPKSRKNSFSSRSRTNSFHAAAGGAPMERRLSVLITEKEEEPPVISSSRRSSVSLNKNRRRESFIKAQVYHVSANTSILSPPSPPSSLEATVPWSQEEDALLLNPALQKDEVSILLHNRTDSEIDHRRHSLQQQHRHLDNLHEETGTASSTSSPSPQVFSEHDRDSGASVVSSTGSAANGKSRFTPPAGQVSSVYKSRAYMASNSGATPAGSSSPPGHSASSPDAPGAQVSVSLSHHGIPTQRRGSVSQRRRSSKHVGSLNKIRQKITAYSFVGSGAAAAAGADHTSKYSDEDAVIDDDSDENIVPPQTAAHHEAAQHAFKIQSYAQHQVHQQNSIHNPQQQTLPSLNSIFRDII